MRWLLVVSRQLLVSKTQGRHRGLPLQNILFILSILVNKKGGSRTAPTKSLFILTPDP